MPVPELSFPPTAYKMRRLYITALIIQTRQRAKIADHSHGFGDGNKEKRHDSVTLHPRAIHERLKLPLFLSVAHLICTMITIFA